MEGRLSGACSSLDQIPNRTGETTVPPTPLVGVYNIPLPATVKSPRTAPIRRRSQSARETRRSMSPLRQQFGDGPAVDVGQAAFDAVVVVGEAFVVDPQQVEDRGVVVVDRDGVLRRLVAQLV